MSILDGILQADAAFAFNDGEAGFAEPITYTRYVAGVPQTPVTLYVVIDRSEPVKLIGEARGPTVRQLSFPIANNSGNPTLPNALPTVNVGDVLTAPWRIGDPPSKFRIVERPNQDIGMWYVVAEMSVN